MAEQPDKELLKLFARTKEVISVFDLRSVASEIREISKLMTSDMLEKVEDIVSDLQVSKTVDTSGAVKRKFEVVEQGSTTNLKDAKVRKTEGADESGEGGASASKGDEADGWPCPSCTFVNHPSLETCEMCDNSRNALVLLQLQLEELKQKTSVVEPPSNWLPIDPTARMRCVKLPENDVDYVKIGKLMSAFGFQAPTSGFSMKKITGMFSSKRTKAPYTIKSIMRIENLHLYQMYQIKKVQMQEENGPLVENEQMLWHGTNSDCVDSIATYGFNRSHCGKNGTAFGKGVYFSAGPSYSSNARYARPDKSGYQYMFYTRVLIGRYTIGNETMVEPPMFLSGLGRFNSLANAMDRPDIFVIFHDAQTYPEFLIKFTTN